LVPKLFPEEIYGDEWLELDRIVETG
jgi:hypothetical protein